MIKVVNLGGLGVDGRQNELIEVALTYSFDAVEVDMGDLLGRNKMMGRDFALQFLKSAGTQVGSFRLPIDFSADEATFRKQFEAMTTICELAGSLNCSTCYAIVESSADELAFQENFDRHQKRLVEAGEQLEKAGIKLGLRLSPKSNRVKRSYNFVQTVSELLTLVRMIGHKNVGICFDALAWVNSEGTIEDMQKLKAEQITEVRLADLQDNIAVLPGNGNDSFSLAVAHHLKAIQYDGLISVVGNPSIFGSGSRDRVLPQLVKRLDEFVELIKGERTELSCNQAAEADDTAVETDNELVKT